MKKLSNLILSLTLSVLPLLSQATNANITEDGCVHCTTETRGLPADGDGLSELEKAQLDLHKKEMKVLAGKICATFENSILTTGKPVEDFEGILVEHITSKTSKKPSRSEITSFLNDNKNYLVCNKVGEDHEEQNFMKRIVSVDLHRHLFYKYLLKDKSIDLNAIDVVDGKQETILDYLDRIEKDPKYSDQENFLKEVAKLKRRLGHPKFGGKRASELEEDSSSYYAQR